LDGFHHLYWQSADGVSRLPNVVDFCEAQPADQDRLNADMGAFLSVWPAGDPNIRGIAILDMSGRVTGGTDQWLVGSDLSYRPYVRAALRGARVISDIHLAESPVGEV